MRERIKVDIASYKDRLNYDPNTGVFTWKIFPKGKITKGLIAGGKMKNGYAYIGKPHIYAHCLAWMFVHGEIPQGMVIDHINGNPGDNRIANLRCVSEKVNLQNQRKIKRNNSSGYLGVKFDVRHNTYSAVISLGGFKTPEEAFEWYLKAKRVLHEGNTL